VSESAREGTPLDLLFVNREGLVGDVMVGGHLEHSNREIIEFLILREFDYQRRRGISGTANLDFRRTNFSLFRCSLGLSIRVSSD